MPLSVILTMNAENSKEKKLVNFGNKDYRKHLRSEEGY